MSLLWHLDSPVYQESYIYAAHGTLRIQVLLQHKKDPHKYKEGVGQLEFAPEDRDFH